MTSLPIRRTGAVLALFPVLLGLLFLASPVSSDASSTRVLSPKTTSEASKGSPYKRPGMWIWYVDSSHGGNAGKIIKRARKSGIGTLYIKSGDGTNTWSQFNRRLVGRFQDAGLKVCGWQYVYGNKPGGEAKVSAYAKKQGADCFVIDAETEYEGRYSAADRYIRALRRRVGNRFPLALSTFPYVHYHPGFPYSVFLGPGAATANLPQTYWKAIGDSVREGVDTTWYQNALYERPIYPVGQTYMNPRAKELMQFRRYMESYGSAPSWWSWQETKSSEWKTLARKSPGPFEQYRPVKSHPTMRKGSRGDQVVWLQQYLNGAGNKVPVTGIFAKKTKAAVIAFQKSRNLGADGVVGTQTWNRLLKVRPVRVRWSAARSRSLGGRISAVQPAQPASAAMPPVRNEIAGAKRR